MSTKRHGNKLVSDLSKLILFCIKKTGRLTFSQIALEINLSKTNYTPEQARRHARYLREKNLLAGNAQGGYSLTNEGRRALEQLSFQNIEQTAPWDKKWRLVIYDIPEQNRQIRDRVRSLLKDLGFYRLQISTWVHPLPCLEQFKQIKQSAKLKDELLLLEVSYLENRKLLIEHFKKRYPHL